jgi:hypothetical protein
MAEKIGNNNNDRSRNKKGCLKIIGKAAGLEFQYLFFRAVTFLKRDIFVHLIIGYPYGF